MTITDFERHIDRYGVDFVAWPADLAESALDLMLQSTEAQDLYAQRSERPDEPADPAADEALFHRLTGAPSRD